MSVTFGLNAIVRFPRIVKIFFSLTLLAVLLSGASSAKAGEMSGAITLTPVTTQELPEYLDQTLTAFIVNLAPDARTGKVGASRQEPCTHSWKTRARQNLRDSLPPSSLRQEHSLRSTINSGLRYIARVVSKSHRCTGAGSCTRAEPCKLQYAYLPSTERGREVGKKGTIHAVHVFNRVGVCGLPRRRPLGKSCIVRCYRQQLQISNIVPYFLRRDRRWPFVQRIHDPPLDKAVGDQCVEENPVQ
jgi:hypothetical protein